LKRCAKTIQRPLHTTQNVQWQRVTQVRPEWQKPRLSADAAGAKLVDDWSISEDIMATVTAFQAKTRFGELLDRVVRGEEIVITRHEKAVARLVPEGGSSLRQIQEVVTKLRAGRSLMAKRRGTKPLTDQEIKEAIQEGRR
jgi:prevent-host-death family protein